MTAIWSRTVAPLMVGVVLLLTGCSSFHREWKTAIQVAPPFDDITGPWEGRWLSSVNGHTGKLRCLMTEQETNTYHARFWGTFWECFRFTYELDLNAQRTGTDFTLSGQLNLGKLVGGLYRYDGHATPTNFTANYSSKADHGIFEMYRPVTSAPRK